MCDEAESKETAYRRLLEQAVDDWPQFDGEGEASGSALVDWFATWRAAVRAALGLPEPRPPAEGGVRGFRCTPRPSRRSLCGADNLQCHCIQRRRFACGNGSPLLGHLGPVPPPHGEQILGVVGAASGRRDTRQGTFPDALVPLEAVGTANASCPKPVRGAVRPVDGSQRWSHLLFALHPPAQVLRSVLVNNSDLVFTPVVVRHVCSPLPVATAV